MNWSKSEADFKVTLEKLDPSLRTILEGFDLDGEGINLKHLRDTAEKWKLSHGDLSAFDLNAFPKALHDSLAIFDPDGDGMISRTELAAACNLYRESKRSANRLRWIVLAMSVVMCLMLGGIFALTYLAVDLSKEMRAAGNGVVTSTGGEALSMGRATRTIPIGEHGFLPMGDLKNSEDLSFTSDGKSYFFKTGSTAKSGETSIRIRAASGEVIEVECESSQVTVDGEVMLPARGGEGRRLSGGGGGVT